MEVASGEQSTKFGETPIPCDQPGTGPWPRVLTRPLGSIHISRSSHSLTQDTCSLINGPMIQGCPGKGAFLDASLRRLRILLISSSPQSPSLEAPSSMNSSIALKYKEGKSLKFEYYNSVKARKIFKYTAGKIFK